MAQLTWLAVRHTIAFLHAGREDGILPLYRELAVQRGNVSCIQETLYLDKIAPFLAKPVVKVLAGMRRVGKSFLLRQIINLLRMKGVPAENILYVDKESLDFEHIRTCADLNAAAVDGLASRPGQRFLFVD